MSSIAVPLGLPALEELPNLKPGVELAMLIETYADRLHELDGHQLVEFQAAIRRQIAHWDAVGLQATQELVLCPPGFEDGPPARMEYPADHAAGELEMACGWSRHRADNQVCLARDLAEDLPVTLAALEAGEFEVDVAREIADGTAVLAGGVFGRGRGEGRGLGWGRAGLGAG